ncbi:MAG: 16S rRNA (guanine(966)-N(2))-methyltransferase RsmD [Acidobacteria bacterium]|nr:16S rRNA (guanine(966)-N(2))-methyltransferase RsmD [Acidobacteriota bacterium]
MRIIAGSVRGTRLQVADVPGLRPTGDRQRETLFNVIREVLPDAEVLDLFAGTGALGLEALSRGGREATFVESSRKAVAMLHLNIAKCGFESASKVIQSEAIKGLRRIAEHGQTFDLVFADPPWAADSTQAWLDSLAAVTRAEALLCLERESGTEVGQHAAWEPRRVLGIGETTFHLLTRIVPSHADC